MSTQIADLLGDEAESLLNYTSTGIPKEAGTGALSLAIGFIDRILTVDELIGGIIGEAERILTSEGIGGWRLAPPRPS